MCFKCKGMLQNSIGNFFNVFRQLGWENISMFSLNKKKIDKDMRVTSQEAPGLIVLELINFNLEKEFL